MDKELKDQKILKSKVKGILKELEEEKQKSLNTIDPECTRINSLQGSHAGFNVQSTVDEKEGLILSVDVVSENNCKIAGADSGYASTDELEKIDKQGIKVIVPSQRQARKGEPHEFAKERFTYDLKNDGYICPKGHKLIFYRLNEKNKAYMISDKRICFSFGHIKRNLKVDSFLLRGQKGVKAEASILGTCFNLVRMITLLGVPALVKELSA